MGHLNLEEAYDVDVVMISDLRLPGGTTSSVAEEVRTQSEAGITTALIHAQSDVTTYPAPWSPHIQSVLDLPGVFVASPRQKLKARLIILRHPTVAESTPETFEHLSADHLMIVVNHAAIDAGGIQHYNVKAADARMRELFGVDPIWAPIGPVVRGTVLQQTREVPLLEQDWVNIFRVPGGAPARDGFLSDKPIIGRHSRPQAGKWPATKGAILQAYPESSKYQVEILGGAQIAEKLVGRVPKGWNVVPFGGEDPHHFLQRIDFWVYMHHPDLKEAFGRAAMEALAAGCVAVMPPYMEELFGDAAVYGTPKDVQSIIDSFWADPKKFVAQSRRAQEFAASFSPAMHVQRLAEYGIEPSAGASKQITTPNPTPTSGNQHQVAEDEPGDRGSAPENRSLESPTPGQLTLEQWAMQYYSRTKLRPTRTADFAPPSVRRAPHLFFDLPVVLVIMTAQHQGQHAGLFEAVQRLAEATYAFRAVAVTDGSAEGLLEGTDWRIEHVSGTANTALSNTAEFAVVEELTWLQLQLGASEVLACWDEPSLRSALDRLAAFAQSPSAVTEAAWEQARKSLGANR